MCKHSAISLQLADDFFQRVYLNVIHIQRRSFKGKIKVDLLMLTDGLTLTQNYHLCKNNNLSTAVHSVICVRRKHSFSI